MEHRGLNPRSEKKTFGLKLVYEQEKEAVSNVLWRFYKCGGEEQKVAS